MITRFTVVVGDEVQSFGTDTAPILKYGESITFRQIPITHPSRRKHLTLDGRYNIESAELVFDRKTGIGQEVRIYPADGQVLEWTHNT